MFYKFISIVGILLIPILAQSQFTISGKIVDIQTNENLPEAHISLGNMTTLSKNDGTFILKNIKKGEYEIKVSYVGYAQFSQVLWVSENRTLEVKMQISTIMEDAITITAYRAHENSGTSFTNISKMEIIKSDLGKDLPYLIDMTPSVVSSSDAGAGIGYTDLKIRGSDMTRINVTINGIPLNDPEGQGVWFVDLPDFASSLNSIQIQRGVGTSVNGPSSFGASIDLQTNGLSQQPTSEVNLSYGSFNTQRYRISTSTGLINDKFSFDVRLSKLNSDGYIDRAFSNMSSYYISGAYYGKNSILRLNIFSGKEKTYQAWNGVPKDSLLTNRTMNSYTYSNETDNYNQTQYQLHYSKMLNKRWVINTALHYTKGSGYYENFENSKKFSKYGLFNYIIGNDTITKSNLIQQKWLDNDFYGFVANANYDGKKLKFVIGEAVNNFEGNHFGNIIWSQYALMGKDYEWYRNYGRKLDINIYSKASYSLTDKFNAYVDVQYRKINYSINGIHDDLHDLTSVHNFNFINPKAGLVYKLNAINEVYASAALANKEPSRNNYRDADIDYSPKAEHLTDYEFGYAFNGSNKLFRLNFYLMQYKDQLVATGKVNNVGEAIMVNVDKSFRRGIEFIASWQQSKFFDWNFNTTLSQNKIAKFTSFVDNWDTWGQESIILKNTDISFSPSIIVKNSFDFHVAKALNISFLSKYIGRQFIDNTSNINRSLNPYFVSDLIFNYSIKFESFKEIVLNFSLNNVFNEMYESNAWVYRYISGNQEYEMNGYFPQAGINFLAGISIKF